MVYQFNVIYEPYGLIISALHLLNKIQVGVIYLVVRAGSVFENFKMG